MSAATWDGLAKSALERAAGEMDEARFWGFVAGIGWPNGNDAAPIRALPAVERLSFVARYYERKRVLEKRLEAWEKEGNRVEAGDDSMSYLVGHVIGLGREAYEATIADPSLAAARALAHDFVEGFYSVVLKADHVMEPELAEALVLYAPIEVFGPDSPMKVGAPVTHPELGVGFVLEEAPKARRILFRTGEKLLPVGTPDARPYDPKQSYAKDDAIVHPAFGKGVVTGIPKPGRIKVLFADGERTLVCAS